MGASDGLNLDIDFYNQNSASVFLETTYVDPERCLIEVLGFCLHSLRMMHNLGPDHPVSLTLAKQLTIICENAETFKIFLEHEESSATLVPATNTPGRKRFTMRLRFRDSEIESCKMTQEGFGFLARGVGHYSPNSVLVLLKYLGNSRNGDTGYLEGLRVAGLGCGAACIEGKVTMYSQGPVAYSLTELATAVMMNENQKG